MQIDFRALEEALAPIAEIGQGELTFDMGGTPVTMRVLIPSEELAVQRHASTALADDDSKDANDAVDYLDRFRIATLSYAIVAVGQLDFRDTEFIETGDKLENGKAVKVPKHKALQTLVGRWSRSLLTRAFRKYSELSNQVDHQADKAIQFEPSDRDAEIERLEEQLKELKATKDRESQKNLDIFSQKMATAVALSDNSERMTENLRKVQAGSTDTPEPEIPEDSQVEAPAPAPVPMRRGPISPQQAAPPADRPVPTPHQVEKQRQEIRPPPPRADSSFINPEDDDSMDAALEAEHQRLLDMRRRNAMGQPQPDDGSARTGAPRRQQMPEAITPARRRPPHMDAAEAESAVGLMPAVAQQARHIGELDGKEVYAMPAQDLEVPAARIRPDRSALDPQAGEGGSRNPRFQSPRRP